MENDTELDKFDDLEDLDTLTEEETTEQPVVVEVQEEVFEIPPHLFTMPLPRDSNLRTAFTSYKSSQETLKLEGESERTVFAESIIDDSTVNTLKELCVRALTRAYGIHPIPMVKEDPNYVILHYDTLDINIPLKKSYQIDSEQYWRRVVLNNPMKRILDIKKEYDWKCYAIEMRFVELLESYAPEEYPEEEITKLAILIKDYMRELHLKHLRTYTASTILKNFQSDEEFTSSSEEDDLETPELSSVASTESETVEEECEENSIEYDDKSSLENEEIQFQAQLKILMAEQKAERKEQRRQLREKRAKEREIRQRRRARREVRRLRRLAFEEARLRRVKKKKLRRQPKNFFKIPITDSEEDEEAKKPDSRNPLLALKYKERYTYPPEDSNHIDLRVIQHFIYLNKLSIEFMGPLEPEDYHERHLRVSTKDIYNLAIGMKTLQVLKIFRFRNTPLDLNKFEMLIDTLKTLPILEVIDFGDDSLSDDCGVLLKELLLSNKTVCNVELETNNLGVETVQQLVEVLLNYPEEQLTYLSLARNPLTDRALCILVGGIIKTKQVTHLNISGVTKLTENGIIKCIARRLLLQYPRLERLDMTAVPMTADIIEEFVNSFQENTTLKMLDCHGCRLKEEHEMAVYILTRRNQFMLENPYINDYTVTHAQIDAWINRKKHYLIEEAMAECKKQRDCKARSKKYIRQKTPVEIAEEERLKEETVKPKKPLRSALSKKGSMRRSPSSRYLFSFMSNALRPARYGYGKRRNNKVKSTRIYVPQNFTYDDLVDKRGFVVHYYDSSQHPCT